MPTENAWAAAVQSTTATPASRHDGDLKTAVWLPNERLAKLWMQYVTNTKVADATPPPRPTNLRLMGTTLRWDAVADPESGLAHFVVERDGQPYSTVPEKAKNPFGRPIFQGLQYSDTPTQPLAQMTFTDPNPEPGKSHSYNIRAVNTVGRKSEPSKPVAFP